MSTQEEMRNERIAKITKLENAGEAPFAVSTTRDTLIAAFVGAFDSLEQSGDEKTIAGRIMSRRGHGGLIFIDMYDGTRTDDGQMGRIQILIREDTIGEERTKLFAATVNVGDIIEITGTAMTTQRGENSMLASRWRMLTKSILPLPKEHFGIKDEDDRFRKRYLDMLLDDEAGKLALLRSKFWNSMRAFLLERAYVEVETPVLENTTGGAEAEPFVTHHNALDIDVYLRISPELWHKRLMVAGVPKVFEIGRIFRNEGMSNEHLQDYTQLEFYEAYSDYTKGMAMVTDMYRTVAHQVFGTGTFTIRGNEIDLDKEWEIYNFCEILKERFDIDPLETTLDAVVAVLDAQGIAHETSLGLGRAVDLLWKSIRKEYVGPGFLVGIPKYLEPLAKSSEHDTRVVERFQVIIAGSEMGKGFSELNDPIDQRERFQEQQAMRDAGDGEAQMADMEYVEALEYGMPPTFGFGVSERLFSFLMDKNIRDAQLFPLMKPETKALSKKEAEALYRSHKIVVIANEEVGYGIASNAVGQLGVSIGMFSQKKLHDTKILRDADNRIHYVDGFYPMTNLAGSQKEMTDFVMKCHEADMQVFDFSEIMRKAHSDKQMIEGYKEKGTEEIEYIAVGAVVSADFEKEFLASLKLFGA